MNSVRDSALTVDVMQKLQNGAAAVKRGARLLDKKVPKGRNIMRKHEADCWLLDPEQCVLGTLEHFSGLKRLQTAKVKKYMDQPHRSDTNAYERALIRLGLDPDRTELAEDRGFNRNELSFEELEALWRAEWSK